MNNIHVKAKFRLKELLGGGTWVSLKASVGVESYQISGALHLGLSALEDGVRGKKPEEIRHSHF